MKIVCWHEDKLVSYSQYAFLTKSDLTFDFIFKYTWQFSSILISFLTICCRKPLQHKNQYQNHISFLFVLKHEKKKRKEKKRNSNNNNNNSTPFLLQSGCNNTGGVRNDVIKILNFSVIQCKFNCCLKKINYK